MIIAGAIIVIGSLEEQNFVLAECLSWSWSEFSEITLYGGQGMLGALVWFAILAAIFVPIGMMFGWVHLDAMSTNVLKLVICAFITMPTALLLDSLQKGFVESVKEDKNTPNEGINLTWRTSWAAFLTLFSLSSLLIGSLSVVICALFPGKVIRICAGGFGLFFAIFCGGRAWAEKGGGSVFKHYALRLTLWLDGSTPFNLIKFLDHCAKLIFLKKVGGGYIFIHRMLLDYFADLTPRSIAIENGKTAQIPASDR
jgi:eukaryotic-like serine/threonine-protein kinase